MQDDPQSTRSMPEATRDFGPERRVHGEEAFEVTAAVGSEPRWEIVSALAEGAKTMEQLTGLLDRSKGTISSHVAQLEDAGVVAADYNITDAGGIEKQIELSATQILLDLGGD
jgi:predicted transcriptional regulator